MPSPANPHRSLPRSKKARPIWPVLTRIQSPEYSIDLERWEVHGGSILLPRAFWDALSVRQAPDYFRSHRIPIKDLNQTMTALCERYPVQVAKIYVEMKPNYLLSLRIIRPTRIEPPLSPKIRQFLNL